MIVPNHRLKINVGIADGVCSVGSALTYLLEHSPEWRMIYTDKVAVLFERTPATAAAPLGREEDRKK